MYKPAGTLIDEQAVPCRKPRGPCGGTTPEHGPRSPEALAGEEEHGPASLNTAVTPSDTTGVR